MTRYTDWFQQLTGFRETTPEAVREQLLLDGEYLHSRANERRFRAGTLGVPTLRELRQSTELPSDKTPRITIREVVGDVQLFHLMPENAGATFQAASQFNLLEMVSPEVTPEMGVTRYAHDRTQGPACAIACGAGTIYRNYFVPLDDQIGQTATRQIDCLSELGTAMKNKERGLWTTRNGYAFPTRIGLEVINRELEKLDETGLDRIRGLLRVGVHHNTEVTLDDAGHTVTQVYCSALPIGYSQIPTPEWEPFARLILDATYEATFLAAYATFRQTGNNRLFLTLVGGGVFGNDSTWILAAIERSVDRFRQLPLDVRVVSYGASNPRVRSRLDTGLMDWSATRS